MKGKKLGKFNIADLFILIVIVAMVVGGGLFVRGRMFQPEQTIVYVVELTDVPDYVVDLIEIGDELQEASRFYNLGTVVDFEIEPMTQVEVNQFTGESIHAEIPLRNRVMLTVESPVVVTETRGSIIGSYFVDADYDIRIGKMIWVLGRNYAAHGFVVEIHNDGLR